jgi:hypothetical protein
MLIVHRLLPFSVQFLSLQLTAYTLQITVYSSVRKITFYSSQLIAYS